MQDMCLKCGMCCKLLPIDWDRKVLVRDGIQPIDESFEELLIPLSRIQAQSINENYVKNVLNFHSNTQFFSCKYLSNTNLCMNPDKPQICKDFPGSPFACLPEDCGHAGEVFIKKEAIKQKIRKLKEEIIDYQAQIASTKDKSEKEHLNKIIIFHQKFIGKYKDFGSRNW